MIVNKDYKLNQIKSKVNRQGKQLSQMKTQQQYMDSPQQQRTSFVFSQNQNNLVHSVSCMPGLTVSLNELNKNLEQLKCVQGQQAILICCSKQCQEYAPICGRKKCQCKAKHKLCMNFFQNQKLQKIVQDKTDKQNKLALQTQKIFDKLIDEISNLRQRATNSLPYVIFSQNDLNMIEKIKTCQTNKLHGKHFSQCSVASKSQQISQKQEQDIMKMKQNLTKLQSSIGKQMTQFDLSLFKQKKQCLVKGYDSQKILKSMTNLNQTYFGSQIMTNDEQVLTLQGFMPRQFKQLSLLYRASSNQFLTWKFWEMCVNIPNTLILVLTQHHKIIGGFTPVRWMKYGHMQQQKDTSHQSFIFSLTQGDKLQLSENDSTYYFNQSWGPQFGKLSYGDLSIKDKCIDQDGSFCFFGMNYKNQKYEKNKSSFEKFTGSSTQYFKIIQWEVFEVVF